MKSLTPAETLAANANTTLRDVARQWPMPRYGLSEKRLKNRMAQIRKAARHGGLNCEAATRLAALLNCSPRLFLYGVRGVSQEAVETQPVATGAANSRRQLPAGERDADR